MPLCPALCLCVCTRLGRGRSAPPGTHRTPGSPPAAELCAGSHRGQPGVGVSGSFPLEFLMPADHHPFCGRGAGGDLGGGAPSQTACSVLGASSQAKHMPALQKDLTASGKGWEDPGWPAGMWTLISAPLLSKEVQALVLGLKGLQLLLGLRVTTWPQAGLSASSSPV